VIKDMSFGEEDYLERHLRLLKVNAPAGQAGCMIMQIVDVFRGRIVRRRAKPRG